MRSSSDNSLKQTVRAEGATGMVVDGGRLCTG